jgi:hypothetical protein
MTTEWVRHAGVARRTLGSEMFLLCCCAFLFLELHDYCFSLLQSTFAMYVLNTLICSKVIREIIFSFVF